MPEFRRPTFEHEPRWPDVAMLELVADERHSNIWEKAEHYYSTGLTPMVEQKLKDLLASDIANQMHPQDRHFMVELAYCAHMINKFIEHPEQWRHHRSLVDSTDQVTLKHPREGAMLENDQRVRTWLEAQTNSRILMTSSTHTATPYLLQAARSGFLDNMRHTAILSFDHHTDMRNYLLNGEVDKASAMNGALDNSFVSRAAVIGPENGRRSIELSPLSKEAEIIPGHILYDEAVMKPQVNLLINRLRSLFTKWKRAGISSIYTTVDLDGLDLPGNYYTGVDYNDFRLTLPLLERHRDFIERMQLNDAEELSALALAGDVTPHYGIPDDWIPLVLQIAREQFGFEIGIRHDTKDQRLVGDVVEYDGPDFMGKTRLAGQKLLQQMLAAAQ